MQKSNQMQFTVGGLLILMTAVAGYFFGFNRGDIDKYLTTMSQSTYPVAELIAPDRSIKEQMAEIANVVEQTIAPDTWISRGGVATVTLYESNQSIVIFQTGQIHRDIERLFSDLHDAVEQRKRDRVVTMTYSLAEVIDDSIEKPVEEQLKIIGILTRNALRPVMAVGQEFRFQVSADSSTLEISTNESFHDLVQSHFKFLAAARKSMSTIYGNEPLEMVEVKQANDLFQPNVASQPISYRSNGTVFRTSDK